MPSSSLLGSRRPAGVTGTHRGQCAWAAWTVLLLMVSAAAKAAPTTPEPTSTDNVNVTAVATPVATAEVNSTGGSGGGSETGFSCEGRIFGYYGDPGNCSLFHYCEPFADPENNQFVLHAAYLCPNDTVFNQLSLTCAYAHEALPCRRAPEYYYINSHVALARITKNRLPRTRGPFSRRRRRAGARGKRECAYFERAEIGSGGRWLGPACPIGNQFPVSEQEKQTGVTCALGRCTPHCIQPPEGFQQGARCRNVPCFSTDCRFARRCLDP
ncbi:hypothetical protein MRX96_034538 [Rhipicephalus microplus]